MTQKHQLKTSPCITYYFMLGWNLSACLNSLYKLRLAGGFGGDLLCVGIGVVVFLGGSLSVSEVGGSSRGVWMEDGDAAQAHL